MFCILNGASPPPDTSNPRKLHRAQLLILSTSSRRVFLWPQPYKETFRVIVARFLNSQSEIDLNHWINILNSAVGAVKSKSQTGSDVFKLEYNKEIYIRDSLSERGGDDMKQRAQQSTLSLRMWYGGLCQVGYQVFFLCFTQFV